MCVLFRIIVGEYALYIKKTTENQRGKKVLPLTFNRRREKKWWWYGRAFFSLCIIYAVINTSMLEINRKSVYVLQRTRTWINLKIKPTNGARVRQKHNKILAFLWDKTSAENLFFIYFHFQAKHGLLFCQFCDSSLILVFLESTMLFVYKRNNVEIL